jgi:sulfonate transport system substrate-binding protein
MRHTIVAAILLAATALTSPSHAEQGVLRVGYQKNGALVILKQQHTLENALKPDGVTVQWVEFQSGPPMMEALNAGGIDVGATGDSPPVFAQAASVDLVYIGYQPVRGLNSAILVPKDSPIHSLSDLRGHSIAFTKGSSAHYQTVQSLATVGLKISDVTPVYLQPSDAAAAFRTGRVDAWAIWDPFYALAQRDPNTKVLTDATIAPSNGFFLASRPYALAHDHVIVTLVHEINAAAAWSGAHQEELAKTMAEITGVDIDTQRVAAARGTYTAAFLTAEVVARQQQVADTFFALKIIPHRVDISSAVFIPRSKSAALQETTP